jgi:predicted transcriptional regulator
MNDPETKGEKKGVHKILQVLACSDLRKSLAETLRDGQSLTLSQLSERVGASSPAAVHALRELAKEQLTYQDEKRNYALTNIGEIVMRKLEEINVGINTLSKHRQFWLEHDLSGIPSSLLDKIGCLEDSEVVTSTPTDLFKIISTYNLLLQNAKEVRGVTPFFTEDMPASFIELVGKGGDIELVVTPEVLDAVLKHVDRSELKKALQTNLKFFTIEPPPVLAFTVTDYFMDLGFFRHDGMYDWSKELLSYSEGSLSWGRKLYQYYVDRAKLFVL